MVKTSIRAALPKLHNSRAEQHWQIVSGRVDFAGKTVADLGVGYGDLSMRAIGAGAYVVGFDKDISPFVNRTRKAGFQSAKLNFDTNVHLSSVINVSKASGTYPLVVCAETDLELLTHDNKKKYDVAMCFSVLPYLSEPKSLLSWMQENAVISFIECQYFGDGPGLETIKNDYDMLEWLSSMRQPFGWEHIERIGKTHIVDRDMYRTVWMCK